MNTPTPAKQALEFACPNEGCGAQPGSPCLDWEQKPRTAHDARLYLVWGGPDAPEAVALRMSRKPAPKPTTYVPGEPPDLGWRLHNAADFGDDDFAEVVAWLRSYTDSASNATRAAYGMSRIDEVAVLADVLQILNEGCALSSARGRTDVNGHRRSPGLGSGSERLIRRAFGLPVDPEPEFCPTCNQKIRRPQQRRDRRSSP